MKLANFLLDIATNEQKRCEVSAFSSCSAKCSKESPRESYEVTGTQYFDCKSEETKPCYEYCRSLIFFVDVFMYAHISLQPNKPSATWS